MTDRDLIETMVREGFQRSEALKLVRDFEASVERRVRQSTERRERLAAAALAGLARADVPSDQIARMALIVADKLIAEIDK
jgi:hypothetical protein